MTTWLHPDPDLPEVAPEPYAATPDPHAVTWLNPVAGRIQPIAEAWQGTPTFRVTQGYHSGHLALDIGNGRGNVDPVSAMRAGRVVKLDPVQGIVGVDHGDGYRTDYAHMTQLAVANGASVGQGQRLGLVDSARDVNAYPSMSPHLHLVMMRNGAMIDPMPYLNQETADMSETIATLTLYPEGPRTWYAKQSGIMTGYALDGSTKQVELAAGSNALADGTAHISQNPQKAPNGSGFVHATNGALAGYYLLGSSVDVPVPDPPDPTPPEPDPPTLDIRGVLIAAALGALGLFLAGVAIAALIVAILTGALPV